MIKKTGLFLMIGVMFAGPLSAEPADPSVPDPVTAPASEIIYLEAFLRTAREQNPDILAARSEWLAAQSKIGGASAFEDPMAGYDIMGSDREARNGPEMQRFSVSQDIPFPPKLIEKRKMATDEARAAEARYKAVEREVVNQLTKLYYDLYFVDTSIQTIQEIKDLLKKFEGVAQARYSNLEGAQRDVAKAQAEVSMSLERLYVLEQQREIIAATMNTLLNSDVDQAIGHAVLPEKPVLSQSLHDLLDLAIRNRQEIKEGEALVSKSEHGKKIAKMGVIPDINVGFEYTFVGSGETEDMNDGKDQWMFPLRIRIPLWYNRIHSEIREAQHELEAQQSRLKGKKNAALLHVRESYHRFISAHKIYELYDNAIVPQAQLALSADQAGYQSGKIGFLDLLDSERVYLNAKLTQIQFFTESLKGYADLLHAAGLDVEDSPHPTLSPQAGRGENFDSPLPLGEGKGEGKAR